MLQHESQRQLYRKMLFSRRVVTRIKNFKSIFDNNRLAFLVYEYIQDGIVLRGDSVGLFIGSLKLSYFCPPRTSTELLNVRLWIK